MYLQKFFSTLGQIPPPYIRNFNPDSPLARTVGVLTKVDRIVEEMKPYWLATFNNKKRNLDNGWFAVKLPAGGDIPWAEARQQESEFFRDKEPWKSIRGDGDRNRLGSEQLTKYVSKLLSKLVVDRLPVISREITEKIYECDFELERLPPRTEQDHAYDTVLTVIKNFSADSAHIQGIPPKPFTRITTGAGLVYQVKTIYDAIRHEVSQHTPRFCPINTPDNGTPPLSSPAWAQLCAKGETVYLDEMIKDIEEAVTRELPGELPYGITPRITHFVKSWQNVAVTAFRDARTVAEDHFKALVRSHFADYERGGLLSIGRQGATVLKAEYSVLQSSIYRQYQPELAPDPAHETSLCSVAADAIEAFLVTLNRDTFVAESAAGVIREILDPNVNSPTADKDHNNALIVMSSAQAELASKRFADVAASCIDHSFLRKLDIRVRKALRALPASTSPEMCLELIQDPTLVEQRQEITEKRNHWINVKNMLDDASRDLESAPSPRVHAGPQRTVSDPRPQSNSDSETSYAPLPVDFSSPSLTEIEVADSE
ncbi:hypothetical protein DFH07DRAFT_935069 [Mycena maculata]|uniref:Dynamin stalk domain-containing protein n=1 Tax=Mycena maculata TaxID=230809 RepID=A0AAD7KGV7_9AGAR|nr:hypothetical protein DFH07DRAFT_935069 [Mycena maculata]